MRSQTLAGGPWATVLSSLISSLIPKNSLPSLQRFIIKHARTSGDMASLKAALTGLFLAVALAATAAAARPAPWVAPLGGASARHLAQVIENPAPYTNGVFDGKIIPVPQGPLAGNEDEYLRCEFPRPESKDQLPGNLFNTILDTIISHPACLKQQALTGGLGYSP
ncbi:MAG: hypothetical protein J3K34DRAFT_443249 [Monoraphidium minutum]|nr:MAG: hypothetical protein J3K34DRAFT_443249 [Monoraphidium minutum]